MNYISKRVEPNRLNSLNGTIYRGVMLNGKPTPIHAGLIKTSIKQYQPWTPSYKVAETFALEYSGNYGVIFHANVAENKNKLLLSIIDAVNLYNKQFNDEYDYLLDIFAHQDEIILKGRSVNVNKIEILIPDKKKYRNIDPITMIPLMKWRE